MEKQKKQSKFASGTTDQEKSDRFKAGGQIAVASLLVGGIFQVLWMSFTPMILGPVGMKLFGEMMGCFYCLGALIATGIPQTITTFVSLNYENAPLEAEKYLADGNKLILLLGMGATVATAVIGGILRALGVISTFWYVMALTMVISCFVMIVFWGYNAIMNGRHRLDYVSAGNLVFPVGQLLGTVGLALAARSIFGKGSDWMVTGAVAGMGIGQLFALAVALVLCTRTKMASYSDLFDIRTNNGLYTKMLTFGGLAAVAFVTTTVVQNFTAPMLGLANAIWPTFSKVELGYFNTSLIFAMAPMLLVGVGIALVPAMSEAEGQGRLDLMQDYYNSAMQQCFSILGVFVTAYALFIGKISSLMTGPQFPESVMGPLSFRMVIGGSAVAMIFVLMNMFIGLKRPAVPAVISILVFAGQIIGIVSTMLLTKNIMWVTVGFSAAPVLGCVAMYVIARAKMGLRFPAWTLLEPAVCALPAWAAVRYGLLPAWKPTRYWLERFVGPEWVFSMLFLVAGLGVMLAVYGLPMWLLEKRRAKLKAALAVAV